MASIIQRLVQCLEMGIIVTATGHSVRWGKFCVYARRFRSDDLFDVSANFRVTIAVFPYRTRFFDVRCHC